MCHFQRPHSCVLNQWGDNNQAEIRKAAAASVYWDFLTVYFEPQLWVILFLEGVESNGVLLHVIFSGMMNVLWRARLSLTTARLLSFVETEMFFSKAVFPVCATECGRLLTHCTQMLPLTHSKQPHSNGKKNHVGASRISAFRKKNKQFSFLKKKCSLLYFLGVLRRVCYSAINKKVYVIKTSCPYVRKQ